MTEYQPSDLRISDVEREDALTKLGEHMTAGRLDIDEYGERTARVAAAKTRGELLDLFGDLPEPKPVFAVAQAPAPAVRERSFVERALPAVAPWAVLLVIAGVFFWLKLPFFLPFLIIFFLVNQRRGGPDHWRGGGGRMPQRRR